MKGGEMGHEYLKLNYPPYYLHPSKKAFYIKEKDHNNNKTPIDDMINDNTAMEKLLYFD